MDLSSGREKMSDGRTEFIAQKTAFIDNYALVIYFVILLILLAGTWLIKYPDIIQANARLTSGNGPKEIIARSEGRMVRLFVKNDQQVQAGQMLFWMESTASHEEILDLSQRLNTCIRLLDDSQSEKVSSILMRSYSGLGELQAAYQQFVSARQQFNDYLINGYYAHKKKLLQQDILALGSMEGNLKNQKQVTQGDLDLSEESFKMNDELYKTKVISKSDYMSEQSKLFNKQLAIPQINSSLYLNETQQREKKRELNQLEHDISQQKVIFTQVLQSLKSSVDEWIKKYILLSPVSGTISFIVPIQQDQFIQTGKLLGYINPNDARYYSEIYIPQYNFGKVDTGMAVQLRLEAYPYQEFGYIPGKLQYISKVATDSGFLATVNLSQHLETNYKIPIQYKNNLRGQALIITRDARLLQRLYYSVIKNTSVGK